MGDGAAEVAGLGVAPTINPGLPTWMTTACGLGTAAVGECAYEHGTQPVVALPVKPLASAVNDPSMMTFFGDASGEGLVDGATLGDALALGEGLADGE